MGLDRCRRWLHHCSLDNDAGGRVSPQGDEELARQGDNDRFAHSPAKALDAFVEPQAERRGWLVPQPQPSQLDHGCPQPRVARLGDTLLVIDRAALPWGWRMTRLTASVKGFGCRPDVLDGPVQRPASESLRRTSPRAAASGLLFMGILSDGVFGEA